MADRRPRPIHLNTTDPDRARKIKNALYDAAKRWNPQHPGDQISLSANLIDPADGKCYARGACRCEQNECDPSPVGAHGIHARVWSKREGRIYQGSKPREKWDYDPMARRPRRPGIGDLPGPGSSPAPSQPGHRFGAQRRVEPDPSPASPSLRGAFRPEPRPTGKNETPRASRSAPPGQHEEQESALSKLRRWASG